MRKILWNDSTYAEEGRLNKAIALSRYIAEHYSPITKELIEVLPLQSHDWWVALSKVAGVNPPSPASVEATLGMLAQNSSVNA